MNTRIKAIRKKYGLNQEQFGARIGIKQQTVTAYECGNRVPMDSTILAICKEFGVNENWLRTGEGDPFPPPSRGEQIGEIAAQAAKDNPEEARQFFSELLGDLTDGEIMLLYRIWKRHKASHK